jgi:hypothetical protein
MSRKLMIHPATFRLVAPNYDFSVLSALGDMLRASPTVCQTNSKFTYFS